MKTIDYYMGLPYKLEIVPDVEEGGYVARYPEEGIEINEPAVHDNYSGQFKLRIPKSLHRSLAEHSKAEGISMNQYCLYLLTLNDAITYTGKQKKA